MPGSRSSSFHQFVNASASSTVQSQGGGDGELLDEGPIRRLMHTIEWSNLKEQVMIEGAFVEVDELESGLELYHIAISENQFILARREVLSYKEDPCAFSARVDPESYGLTIKAMIALSQLHLSAEPEKFMLIVEPDERPRRRFFLCTTANIFDRFDIWFHWIDEMNALRNTDFPINVLRKPASIRDALPMNTYNFDGKESFGHQKMKAPSKRSIVSHTLSKTKT